MSRMHHQRGFSVVELMVAMTLSLILMAGALSILYSSKITYNENDRIARLQEAGRAAVELLLRDARGAGYSGCARPQSPTEYLNNLTNANTVLWNFSQPLFGYESTGMGTWAPALDPLLTPSAAGGSDVLVIRGARQGMPVFRTTVPVTTGTMTAPVTVARALNATLPPNSPIVISDCEGSAVFMANSFNPAGGIATLTHTTAGVPGNQSTSLGRTFQSPAQVIPVQTTIYYVRDSTSGLGPALWQKVGSAAPRVLIEGVERLQALYGEDTNGDLIVDRYVRANFAGLNWDNVISVSIALLIRSDPETGTEVDSRTYQMLTEPVLGPFNDRRQRAMFVTTATLRNRTN